MLRRIGRSELLELFRDDPDIAAELVGILCARLRWISQQVEDLALLNVEGRVASRLIILHRKFSDASGQLHISQSELADFLGITRETTNKVLQSWRAAGLIDLSRGAIRICNHHALSEVAEAFND